MCQNFIELLYYLYKCPENLYIFVTVGGCRTQISWIIRDGYMQKGFLKPNIMSKTLVKCETTWNSRYKLSSLKSIKMERIFKGILDDIYHVQI